MADSRFQSLLSGTRPEDFASYLQREPTEIEKLEEMYRAFAPPNEPLEISRVTDEERRAMTEEPLEVTKLDAGEMMPEVAPAQMQELDRNPTSEPLEIQKLPEELPTDETQSEPTYIDRLKDAQERSRELDLGMGLLKASEMLGRSISGVGYKPEDLKRYDEIAESGRRMPQEVAQLEKAKREEEIYDPNSSISQLMRDQLKSVYPQLADRAEFDNLSAKQLKDMGLSFPKPKEVDEYKKALTKLLTAKAEYYPEEMQLKREREGRLTERQETDFDKNIYKVTQDFEKDDLNKELKKQGLAFTQAEGLMEQIETEGNEVALGALGTKMARAMGEVGVLTEADVKRYIQAQSAIRSATDATGRILWGQISDETIQDIRSVNEKMLQGFGQKKEEVFNKYVDKAYKNFGKRMGLEREEVADRFGETIGVQPSTTPEQSDTVLVRAPNGSVRKIPRDKLDQAIKAGGELVK